MVQFKDISFIAFIGLLVFFSGCISNQELSKPTGEVSQTGTVTPASTQISQASEQNKINCPGDLNGDSKINFDDFVMFAAAYGTHIGDADFNLMADLNHDNDVDFDDFVTFASVYGTSCKA
jgi:hypothetical protein